MPTVSFRSAGWAFALLACIAAAPAWLSAQDNPLAPVADFLEEQTIVAGRVDLSQVDIAAAVQFQARLWGGEAPPDLTLEPLETALATLRKQGRYAYFQWSLPDALAQRPPAVLFPAENSEAVLQLLRQFAGEDKVHQIGKVVVIADPVVRDRLADMPGKGNRRPGLLAAAAAAAEWPHWVALELPADLRKVLNESLPDLPEELGGAKGIVLGKSVRWAAVGLRLPPKLALHVKIQSEQEEASQALAATLQALLQQAPLPLAPLLQISQQGPLLDIKLDDRNGKLSAVVRQLIQNPSPLGAKPRVINNLKQVGLAFHNYHDTHGAFPPFANGDKEGRPLLSWRVHILPFIEHQELYNRFHLDEPWDSEHNRALIGEMPNVYQSIGERIAPGTTCVQTPLLAGSLMGDKEVPRLRDITDGTSNTVMTFLAPPDKAVIWTQPNDIRIDPADPLKGLFPGERTDLKVGFCDGSVRIFAKGELTAKLWLAYLTKAAGDAIEDR